jgi:hypothetical protein
VRRTVLLCACAVLAAGPTALAFASGGYFETARLVALAVAAVALAAVAITSRSALPATPAGRVALLALALYAGWIGLAGGWAPVDADARADLQRALLYLAAFAAAAGAFRARERLAWLEPALAAGALVVVGYGLAGRLLPSLVDLARSSSAGGRLEQPLTYWNATGALAAIGFVLCARLVADRPALRRAAAAAAVPLAMGVYLSFSRGALAALAGGLLLLLLLVPTIAQARAIALTVGAGAIASAAAGASPAVRALEGDNGATQGAAVLVAALLLAALAATLAERTATGARLLPTWTRPAAVAGLAALVVLPFVLGGDDQPAAFGATNERFSNVSSNRYDYWEVALDVGADHPLAGVGPGGFAVEWLRHRDIDEPVRDAHSLPLETFAELGLVGVALLALLLAVAGLCLARARAPGLVAASGVWVLGSAIDWSWEMPALTLVAVVAAGAAAGQGREPDRGEHDEPRLGGDAEAGEAVRGE